ncbi:MAG: hypothetical protein AAFX99_33300, partial [Myxococcota bacterium]
MAQSKVTLNDRNPSEIQVRKRTPHHMPATFVRQGHLRTTPFDMLLRLALTSHAYGRLDLQEGKHRRQIMFLGGLPVSVRSNIDGESLLGFIHKRKLIDSQVQLGHAELLGAEQVVVEQELFLCSGLTMEQCLALSLAVDQFALVDKPHSSRSTP